MEESDRDEVKTAPTTVKFDSRHNVKQARVGIRPNPGSEVETDVVGIDQSLTVEDIPNGEDPTWVGSFDTDQPDKDLTQAEKSLYPPRG